MHKVIAQMHRKSFGCHCQYRGLLCLCAVVAVGKTSGYGWRNAAGSKQQTSRSQCVSLVSPTSDGLSDDGLCYSGRYAHRMQYTVVVQSLSTNTDDCKTGPCRHPRLNGRQLQTPLPAGPAKAISSCQQPLYLMYIT